jgi:hypothetical protein
MPALLHTRLARAIAGIAIAFLTITGITVIGAQSASAHTPRASATCTTLSVSLTDYSAGATNTVKVVIDDNTVENTGFGANFTKDYTFDNSAVSHDYSVIVHTSDDPDGSKGYSVTINGSSTPCTPAAPTVHVSATQCTTPGGTSGGLAATVDGTTGRSYTATVQQSGSSTPLQTKNVTNGSVSFSDLPTGVAYTVTVKDSGANVKTTSSPVTLNDCPPLIAPTVDTAPTQCTVYGGTGDISATVTGGTPGRSYTATVQLAGSSTPIATKNVVNGAVDFTGLNPGASYTITVTDTGDSSVHTTTSPVVLVDCPLPPAPSVSVSPTQCTVPDGTGTVTATVTGTTGRSYVATVQVQGSSTPIATKDVVDGSVAFTGLNPGASYTVTVTDKDASSLHTTSSAVGLNDCPLPPQVQLSSTQQTCTTPGQTIGTLDAQVSGQKGDTFTVTVLDANNAVVATKSITGEGSVAFDGLTGGASYTSTVHDTTNGLTTSAGPVVVAKCALAPVPPTPTPTPAVIAPATASQNLAETGLDVAPIAWGAGALAFLGALAFAVSALARRRSMS